MVMNLGFMAKIGVLCGLIVLSSCSDTSKPVKQDTLVKPTDVKVAPIDTASLKKPDSVFIDDEELQITDSINFAKYATNPSNLGVKASVNFNNYPEAKQFKTRILEGYENGEVNFAGHYIAIYFGCGASCILGFIVDVTNGEIYDLPLGEENMCFWSIERALYTVNSNLFISSICKENEKSKELYYIASVWNEENKKFNTIKSEEFIVR